MERLFHRVLGTAADSLVSTCYKTGFGWTPRFDSEGWGRPSSSCGSLSRGRNGRWGSKEGRRFKQFPAGVAGTDLWPSKWYVKRRMLGGAGRLGVDQSACLPCLNWGQRFVMAAPSDLLTFNSFLLSWNTLLTPSFIIGQIFYFEKRLSWWCHLHASHDVVVKTTTTKTRISWIWIKKEIPKHPSTVHQRRQTHTTLWVSFLFYWLPLRYFSLSETYWSNDK